MTPIRRAFARALACALLLAAGPAVAQTARVVTDCTVSTSLPTRDATGLMVDQNGRLCTSVGAAGNTASIGSTTLRSAGTPRSATVGTTAANLWPANTARQGGWIKNDSASDIWCNYDGAAAATAGGGNFRIAASGGFYDTEANFVSTNALSCIGTASVAITSREH